jgi:hypothetical protein
MYIEKTIDDTPIFPSNNTLMTDLFLKLEVNGQLKRL